MCVPSTVWSHSRYSSTKHWAAFSAGVTQADSRCGKSCSWPVVPNTLIWCECVSSTGGLNFYPHLTDWACVFKQWQWFCSWIWHSTWLKFFRNWFWVPFWLDPNSALFCDILREVVEIYFSPLKKKTTIFAFLLRCSACWTFWHLTFFQFYFRLFPNTLSFFSSRIYWTLRKVGWWSWMSKARYYELFNLPPFFGEVDRYLKVLKHWFCITSGRSSEPTCQTNQTNKLPFLSVCLYPLLRTSLLSLYIVNSCVLHLFMIYREASSGQGLLTHWTFSMWQLLITFTCSVDVGVWFTEQLCLVCVHVLVEEVLVCSDRSQPKILQGLNCRGGELICS